MRICDRIFCQNPHIAYFSAYNGIFKIAYAKIMPHVQKFAYILIHAAYFPHVQSHLSAFALSNVVLCPLNILASNDYQYVQLNVK